MQARLDRGPHGVPRGCQLSSQSCNGGSLDAQLSDRPADHPHTQTRPGSAHLLAVLQECHRLAGAFSAYPASLVPPDPHRDPGPRARRSPPPPRARALEQVTPQPGHPAQRSHRSLCRAPDHTHAEQQVGEALKRSLTIAGVEDRSSSRTLTSARNPRPTPGHPHSTLKSP